MADIANNTATALVSAAVIQPACCSRHMGATFTPLVCSVYGLLHPDALALLRLQA
jgi:hypothetical protein